MAAKTLDLREKIEGHKDELVRRAEKLCDAHRPRVARAGLQNLLTIANSTLSVEEVKNFIKYQMGRKTEARKWRDFGEYLIKEIEEIVNNMGISGNSEFNIQLVRLFLGYVTRYAQFLGEERGRRR